MSWLVAWFFSFLPVHSPLLPDIYYFTSICWVVSKAREKQGVPFPELQKCYINTKQNSLTQRTETMAIGPFPSSGYISMGPQCMYLYQSYICAFVCFKIYMYIQYIFKFWQTFLHREVAFKKRTKHLRFWLTWQVGICSNSGRGFFQFTWHLELHYVVLDCCSNQGNQIGLTWTNLWQNWRWNNSL